MTKPWRGFDVSMSLFARCLMMTLAASVTATATATATTATVATSGIARSGGGGSSSFLWLSDIHFDPYYGTPKAMGLPGANCFHASSSSETTRYGQVGCDSPYALVQAAIQQAAFAAPSSPLDATGTATGTAAIDFVIVTGDICRHANDQLDDPLSQTQAILSNVSQLLRSTLAQRNHRTQHNDGQNTNGQKNNVVTIIPSLGNNDVHPDYYLDVEDPTELLTMITAGFDALLESSVERATFLKGGYLARNVTDRITVLSLNTILYSTSHIPAVDDDDDDPLGQFAWLEEQLRLVQASGRVVYIIGHIPPAMGSYRHTQLWHKSHVQKYYSILSKYYDDQGNADAAAATTTTIIVGQFFGHLHSDEFRWIRPGAAASDAGSDHHQWPLWLAPSITPIYGSNPSIRRVSYNSSTGALLDYDTYYLNLLNKNDDDDNNNNNDDDDDDENSNGENHHDRTSQTTTALQWIRGPSFRESFGLVDMSTSSLQSLIEALNRSVDSANNNNNNNNSSSNNENDDRLWNALLARQNVHAKNIPNTTMRECQDVPCRRGWICTLTTITQPDFAECLAVHGAAGPVRVWWAQRTFFERVDVAGGSTVVLLLLLIGWMGCRRYRRRRHYHCPENHNANGSSESTRDHHDQALPQIS